MAYDLEEQESLAEIKAWWDKWGTLILSIVTICCLASAAYQGWRWYQMKESTDAGVLYAQMIQAENTKDSARVMRIADRLHNDYSSTTYAGLGSLLAARSAEAAGKPEDAERVLRWIVNSDKYPELQAIAAVRLAGLQMDAGKYKDALATLDGIKDTTGQEGIINDRRGDIQLASGDKKAAKTAWENALRSLDATNPLAALVQMKLSSLPQS